MTTTQDMTHPFIAVHIQATGIHPSTGRLLTIDAVTFDEHGSTDETFHTVLNTGGDPGPRHMHGIDASEFEQASRFSRHLKTLDALIDDRTLVVHDSPKAWGFLVSEARRAMNAAARANRSRNRGRGRRRQRVGHVPRPEAIVDTLASAYRQGLPLTDTRLAAVAKHLNVDAPDPGATVERAQRPEEETSREQTLLLVDTFLALKEAGRLASHAPDELTADRFGLQRTHIRANAELEDSDQDNPGVYDPAVGLKPGMEFVVSDDVSENPEDLIEAGLSVGLSYAEKLTRTASLVISNVTTDLRGKAMHAQRKGIPLVSDKDFLEAVARTQR